MHVNKYSLSPQPTQSMDTIESHWRWAGNRASMLALRDVSSRCTSTLCIRYQDSIFVLATFSHFDWRSEEKHASGRHPFFISGRPGGTERDVNTMVAWLACSCRHQHNATPASLRARGGINQHGRGKTNQFVAKVSQCLALQSDPSPANDALSPIYENSHQIHPRTGNSP